MIKNVKCNGIHVRDFISVILFISISSVISPTRLGVCTETYVFNTTLVNKHVLSLSLSLRLVQFHCSTIPSLKS